MQLEESEATRSEFLEKTRILVADLKRQNQKLHEENVQLKQRLEDMRILGQPQQQHVKTDFRTKMHTQESSKERNSKTRLGGFDIELKRQYGSEMKELNRTPTK
jgi:hypothetical protein